MKSTSLLAGAGLLALAGLWVGCGSDVTSGATAASSGSSGAGGSVTATWSDGCEAIDARRAKCNGAGKPADLASCKAFGPCAASVFRADLIAGHLECLTDRACDEGEDPCYSAAGAGGTPSPAAVAYQGDCLSRLAQCQDIDESFGDDGCFADIVSDDLLAELGTCLTQPCSAISDCFEGMFEGAYAACPGAEL